MGNLCSKTSDNNIVSIYYEIYTQLIEARKIACLKAVAVIVTNMKYLFTFFSKSGKRPLLTLIPTVSWSFPKKINMFYTV